MRYLLIALLLAGAAGCGRNAAKVASKPEPLKIPNAKIEQTIRFGDEIGRIDVIPYSRGDKEYLIFTYQAYDGAGIAVVEIRPTPAEMEDR